MVLADLAVSNAVIWTVAGAIILLIVIKVLCIGLKWIIWLIIAGVIAYWLISSGILHT
ncbi:MAG: hypothetical protein WC454_06100 [Phycisphaerae bacterium]|jgi:hypothetical protein